MMDARLLYRCWLCFEEREEREEEDADDEEEMKSFEDSSRGAGYKSTEEVRGECSK